MSQAPETNARVKAFHRAASYRRLAYLMVSVGLGGVVAAWILVRRNERIAGRRKAPMSLIRSAVAGNVATLEV